MIESQTFSTGGFDSCSSSFGESEGGDRHLGAFEESNVVRDGSDGDDGVGGGVGSVGLGDLSRESGEGKRGSVDSGHEESSENDLVEFRFRSSGQESVKLSYLASAHAPWVT